MSFTLGFYDLFANIIPGFMYLFVLNEILRETGYTYLDVTKIDNLTYFILLGLLAYLAGHNMDYLSYRLWVRVFYRDYPEDRAYKQFKSIYPELNMQLSPRQSSLYFGALKHFKNEITDDIEKNKVVSIMLRNISFAFIIFFLSQVYIMFVVGFSITNLIIAIASLIASVLTLRRADQFRLLYYRLVFEHISLYGATIQEIIDRTRKSGTKNSQNEKPRRAGRRKSNA